jgi:hypothetical protein
MVQNGNVFNETTQTRGLRSERTTEWRNFAELFSGRHVIAELFRSLGARLTLAADRRRITAHKEIYHCREFMVGDNGNETKYSTDRLERMRGQPDCLLLGMLHVALLQLAVQRGLPDAQPQALPEATLL